MRAVRAYIGLGSNLGNRDAFIRRAVTLLDQVRGVRVLRTSRLRTTDPVGCPGPRFLNGVAEVRCSLDPHDLLSSLMDIENRLGRRRSGRWSPRTIDLDILVFGRRIVRSRALRVPHPRLLSRPFVLEPLTELRPRLRVPGLDRTVSRLLAEVTS